MTREFLHQFNSYLYLGKTEPVTVSTSFYYAHNEITTSGRPGLVLTLYDRVHLYNYNSRGYNRPCKTKLNTCAPDFSSKTSMIEAQSEQNQMTLRLKDFHTHFTLRYTAILIQSN